MLRSIQKLIGDKRKQLIFPIFLMSLDAIGSLVMYLMLYFTVIHLLNGSLTGGLVRNYTIVCLISIILRLIIYRSGYFLCFSRGAEMCSGLRLDLANHYRSLSLGYFNQNSLGNITAVATTILSDVETTAPVVLVTTLGGFINAVVFAVVILLFDWRIGLLVVAAMILFLWVTSLMEKRTRRNAPLRQAAQEKLVSAALETIQGMSVVKAFNLNRDKNKRMEQAIDNSCTENASMEKSMSPYLWLQQLVLDLFSVAIMLLSTYFYLQGTMPLAYCLMMIVASFMIFGELKKGKDPIVVFTDYGELRDGEKVQKSTLLTIKRILLLPMRVQGFQNVRFFKRLFLRFGNPVCCPATTYIRKKFKGDPFEVRFSSNVDWMMLEKQSREEGSFCYISDIGMYHRIHEKSTTTEIIHGDIRWREDYEMFRKFWPAWVAKPLVRVYRLSEKSNNIQQREEK